MKPMSKWTFKVGSMNVHLTWELSLQSWHDVVEWEGVGGEVDPSGVSGK